MHDELNERRKKKLQEEEEQHDMCWACDTSFLRNPDNILKVGSSIIFTNAHSKDLYYSIYMFKPAVITEIIPVKHAGEEFIAIQFEGADFSISVSVLDVYLI